MASDKIELNGVDYIRKEAIVEIAERIKSAASSATFFDQGVWHAMEILIEKVGKI